MRPLQGTKSQGLKSHSRKLNGILRVLLQCDKLRPGCQRCQNYGKPCPGYHKGRRTSHGGQSLHHALEISPQQDQGMQVQAGARSMAEL